MSASVEATLHAAGDNRSALEAALGAYDGEERAWMEFLIAHMPAADARTLGTEFLVEHVTLASQVRHEVPASMDVPEDVFRDYVLPYAHLDERRDRWRPLLLARFAEDARRSASIEDAVQHLNRAVFDAWDVQYHPTRRPHDSMSPFESMEWRFASCTGLSILLASACRAVGIPARVAGTPQWTDGSGNHTWVEFWDHGTWKFVGALESGAPGRTWFNDAVRAVAASPEHGVYAARWSPGDAVFPLAWDPDVGGVPADDRRAYYADVAPTPAHPTRIVTEPRRYVCPKLEAPLALTGRMDDPQWEAVPWTEDFVDIEGHRKPTPRFRTRAKMAWDETYFYVGAYLEDPHVVATLTEKNSIIFNDPDFEVFIDPDGDNHDYYEFEINALGTIWELHLERPYRDGGPIHRGKNLPGLQSAVHVDGTLNDPSDVDRGWSVEIAFPWAALAAYAGGAACPPHPGDRWRVNFSRVHWLFDVLGTRYRKVDRGAHPEDNWVWSPQDAVDMHRPEKFGYVTFAAEEPGAQAAEAVRDPTWPARERLMALYYDQRARPTPSLDPSDFEFPGVPHPGLGPVALADDASGWRASIDIDAGDRGVYEVSVDAEGRLREQRR